MDKPVPAIPCQNCGGIIWRQGSWFQCPDCGCLSTAYGGHFANVGEDGKELGVEPEFKAAIDAVRCNFALRYKESIWLMREPDGAFATTSSESERTLFCLFDAEKLLRELGEGWEIYNVREKKN